MFKLQIVGISKEQFEKLVNSFKNCSKRNNRSRTINQQSFSKVMKFKNKVKIHLDN